MTQLDTTLAVAGITVILLGLISTRIDRAPLSAPLLALTAGVLAGPIVFDWMRPETWGHPETILKEAARFTLAVSVMGIALRTPPASYHRVMRPVAVLLSLGMVAMWAISSGVAWATLGMAPGMALALGAIVTPTDPVVASSIVTGKPAEARLPDELRSTLSLESGANDGLGYLLVMLPVPFLSHSSHDAWSLWLRDTVAVCTGARK